MRIKNGVKASSLLNSNMSNMHQRPQLKNNIRDSWWKHMVECPPLGPDGAPLQIVGLDSAIIQNPKVWEASGHVGGIGRCSTTLSP